MVNTSLPLSDQNELYLFGGKNYRDTNAYAFSRDSFANGDNRSVPSLYPNGFTPRITSIITDDSFSAGLRHKMKNGWRIDFNNTYGRNNFHYYILDTNNASLKDASPTDFDAGGHFLSQNTSSIDINQFYENTLEGVNIAFGLEYRVENFGIFSGEPAAPDHKLGLNFLYKTPKFNVALGLTKFSEVVLQDFQWVDTPPLTQAEANNLLEKATDIYESRLTIDLSLGYELSDHLSLQIGANNLLNTYPTPQFDAWTDQGGLADSVQMGSDGRYVFTRVTFNF